MLDVTGLGPGPDCAMLLGDLGADVIRLERPGSGRFREPHKFIPHPSRRSIVVDLSRPMVSRWSCGSSTAPTC